MAHTVSSREDRLEACRRGGAKSQRPEQLAVRIYESWPDLNEYQRDVIRTLLRPIIAKHRTRAVS
jgi:hypothetical protein